MKLTITGEPAILPELQTERECTTLYALTMADAIRAIYAAQKWLEGIEERYEVPGLQLSKSPERRALEECLRRAGHPEWMAK